MEKFKILEVYEGASGQCLNEQKTSILFSSNTKQQVRRQILEAVGARLSGNCEKYLGLPVVVGKSRYNAFKSIKDKVWQRLSNWKNKFLSQAGKEVLLKAIIKSIPTYYMSVFRLPNKLCNEISSLMARFWWGQKYNEKKIQWKGWEKMDGFQGH